MISMLPFPFFHLLFCASNISQEVINKKVQDTDSNTFTGFLAKDDEATFHLTQALTLIFFLADLHGKGTSSLQKLNL